MTRRCGRLPTCRKAPPRHGLAAARGAGAVAPPRSPHRRVARQRRHAPRQGARGRGGGDLPRPRRTEAPRPCRCGAQRARDRRDAAGRRPGRHRHRMPRGRHARARPAGAARPCADAAVRDGGACPAGRPRRFVPHADRGARHSRRRRRPDAPRHGRGARRQRAVRRDAVGPAADGVGIGRDAGAELRAHAGEGFFTALAGNR